MNSGQLAAQLVIDEDKRHKLYKDSVGEWSIGVGRNLDDIGLSDDEINYLLKNDIGRAVAQLDALLPWWRKLNEKRQNVLANMCFNMGINSLMKFKNTLQAMQEGRFDDAASGMLSSLWAQQVGQRAIRLAKEMKEG
jgi:lysozyme